jgi:hypothetical protein
VKFAFSIIATVVYLVVLIATYYIHINFFRVDVVFYAAVADGVFAAFVALMVTYALRILKTFTNFENFLLFSIWVLTGYSFAISVPTVIDRSLSFYILEKIQQRGGGIQQDRFSEVFTNEYMIEHRLVDVRLTEQVESGTIVIDQDQCVRLTAKGEHIAHFGRYFRTNWLPKERLLMGEYSDELTDPFRNSIPDPGYSC